jgi:hypothetical protein
MQVKTGEREKNAVALVGKRSHPVMQADKPPVRKAGGKIVVINPGHYGAPAGSWFCGISIRIEVFAGRCRGFSAVAGGTSRAGRAELPAVKG